LPIVWVLWHEATRCNQKAFGCRLSRCRGGQTKNNRHAACAASRTGWPIDGWLSHDHNSVSGGPRQQPGYRQPNWEWNVTTT